MVKSPSSFLRREGISSESAESHLRSVVGIRVSFSRRKTHLFHS